MADENFDLIEDVDQQIIKIRTKSLDVSFNELYDMYKNGELKISPDYQRLFRWGEENQSRFIESLLLEMPVPPVFVIETDDGIYELIDGLQRISSYLHFRGELLENGDEHPLVLSGCDIIDGLNGFDFINLPKSLQIKLKRSFIRMEVVKKESEASLKYHMFKRLNTGGEILSAQEIRNCTIRLLGDTGINFIKECSLFPAFKKTISRLDEERLARLENQELVLRFFALKNNLDGYKYPVTDYLTDFLEKMTEKNSSFDFAEEKSAFEKTFSLIDAIFGDEAFSSVMQNGVLRNNFSVYLFDGIAVGIANEIKHGINSAYYEKIRENFLLIKSSDPLRSYTTGKMGSIKARIQLF